MNLPPATRYFGTSLPFMHLGHYHQKLNVQLAPTVFEWMSVISGEISKLST